MPEFINKKYNFTEGIFICENKNYKDFVDIAQEWTKDENFYEIIVRPTSEKNWEIQLIYIFNEKPFPIQEYKKKIEEKIIKITSYNFTNHTFLEKEEFQKAIEQAEFNKDNYNPQIIRICGASLIKF